MGGFHGNDTAICETFKTSYRKGKQVMKGELENHSKGPVIPLELMIEYHPVSAADRSRLHQNGRKVLPCICLGHALYACRIWKGDSMVADMKELEKFGRVRPPCSKTQCNGSHHVEKLSKKHHIPDRRWNSQVVWNRSGFPKIHLNSGPPCTREHNDVRRIGRVSTIGQING